MSTDDYQPGTRALLSAMAVDAPGFTDRDDESSLVVDLTNTLNNEAYEALGHEGHAQGAWDATPEVVDALRLVLQEQSGWRAEDVARTLAHFGCSQPATLARLSGWDRMMYAWRAEGRVAADVFARLDEAGLPVRRTADAAALVDARIAEPRSALGDSVRTIDALFGLRVVDHFDSRDEFPTDHAGPLRKLVGACPPRPAVKDIAQDNLDGDGDACVLTATVDEHAWSFRLALDDGQLNPGGIVAAFDDLMASAERPERALRFVDDATTDGDSTSWLVADPARFLPIAEALHLPVSRASRSR